MINLLTSFSVNHLVDKMSENSEKGRLQLLVYVCLFVGAT